MSITDNLPTVTHDPKNPFMFRGTENKLNYYLIAEKGPIILGVRILAYQISSTEAHVGFRIRCQRHPEFHGIIDPSAFKDTWDGIDWSRADGIRASKVMVQTVQMEPGQYDQLEKVVKKSRMIGKLMALLGSACEIEDLAYEQEDLEEVLLTEVEKQMGVHTSQGNVGIPGEATADKDAPLVDGQKDMISKVKAAAKAEILKEDPDAKEADVTQFVDDVFGGGSDAAEAGSPLATFMVDDDDDDSGLLPN